MTYGDQYRACMGISVSPMPSPMHPSSHPSSPPPALSFPISFPTSQDYKDGMTLDEALEMGLKIMAKSMDSTSLTSDKVEIATLTRDEGGRVVFRIFDEHEIKPWLDKVNAEKKDDE